MRKFSYHKSAVFFAGLVLLMMCSGTVQAASPDSVVRDSNNNVSAILQGHDKVSPAMEQRLMQIISKVTAFDTMSSMVSSDFPAAVKVQTAAMAKFRKTFSELLLVSSVNKMGRYRAKRYVFGRTVINGSDATVYTVAYYKNDQVDLVYKLKLIQGQWMIVNYVLDQIDTVYNYKKQFAQMFRLGWSLDRVIARLQTAIDRIRQD